MSDEVLFNIVFLSESSWIKSGFLWIVFGQSFIIINLICYLFNKNNVYFNLKKQYILIILISSYLIVIIINIFKHFIFMLSHVTYKIPNLVISHNYYYII